MAPKGAGSSKPLYARRALTLVAIVSGAATKKEADAILDQLESGTQITWNEPTFEFKEPGIGVMIVGAIMGTGVICLFAIIAGLAFGGVRLVVKRATKGSSTGLTKCRCCSWGFPVSPSMQRTSTDIVSDAGKWKDFCRLCGYRKLLN